MGRKMLAALLVLSVLSGCRTSQRSEIEKKPKPVDSSESEQPQSERDQLESEVREGGFKDPGGAKSLREESAEQQKNLQEQADQVDQ